ncbi:MAG: hypothetical protein JWR26_1520 [Pedosphaera sp.]|nr:hypothetical protein [Pedosphaera sp.]
MGNGRLRCAVGWGDWLGRWTRSGCWACPPSLSSYGGRFARGFEAGLQSGGERAPLQRGGWRRGVCTRCAGGRVSVAWAPWGRAGKGRMGGWGWQTTRHDPPRPATTRHDPPRPATTRGYFIFLCLHIATMGRQTDWSDRGPGVGNSLCFLLPPPLATSYGGQVAPSYGGQAPRCARIWARRTGFPSLASQLPTQDVRFAKSNLSLPIVGWLAREQAVWLPRYAPNRRGWAGQIVGIRCSTSFPSRWPGRGAFGR